MGIRHRKPKPFKPAGYIHVSKDVRQLHEQIEYLRKNHIEVGSAFIHRTLANLPGETYQNPKRRVERALFREDRRVVGAKYARDYKRHGSILA